MVSEMSRRIKTLLAGATLLVTGVWFATPVLADTIRPIPMTAWKSLSVSGGSMKVSGKTRGYRNAMMSSDGVWHSKAEYTFSASKS